MKLADGLWQHRGISLRPRGRSGLKFPHAFKRAGVTCLRPRGRSGLKWKSHTIGIGGKSLRPRGRSGLKFYLSWIYRNITSLRPRGRSGLKYVISKDGDEMRMSPSSRAEWVEILNEARQISEYFVSVLAGGVG